MAEENKASKMVEAILNYIYEEGEDKLTNAEILGVIEFVKLHFIEDFNQLEEVE